MSNDTPNPAGQTPEGWYRDNTNPQIERWWDGTNWTAQTRYAPPTGPAAGAAQAKPRAWYTKKRWWIPGLIVGLFIVIGLASGGEDTTGTDPATVAEAPAADNKAASEEKKPAEKPKPKYTRSQEQAIKAAENYLDFASFSKKGLIRQLSSDAGEGFPEADARFAVNHIKVDWNAEAVEAAENYLDFSSFSRDGLIQQLTSPAGEQFTLEQATYAADKVGL